MSRALQSLKIKIDDARLRLVDTRAVDRPAQHGGDLGARSRACRCSRARDLVVGAEDGVGVALPVIGSAYPSSGPSPSSCGRSSTSMKSRIELGRDGGEQLCVVLAMRLWPVARERSTVSTHGVEGCRAGAQEVQHPTPGGTARRRLGQVDDVVAVEDPAGRAVAVRDPKRHLHRPLLLAAARSGGGVAIPERLL